MTNKEIIDVEAVKRLMSERGLDNEKMAQLLKVMPATVKRYLSGNDQSHYSIIVIFKLARALKVPITAILQK